jgi:hypothetical protein
MNTTNVLDANTAIELTANVEDVEQGAVKQLVAANHDLKSGKGEEKSRTKKLKKPVTPNAPYWSLFRHVFCFPGFRRDI